MGSSSNDPEGGQVQPRRRNREEMVRDARTRWEKTIDGRGVKNERHILLGTFPHENEVNVAVARQGLSFWFEENKGYNTALVEEFYKNYQVPSAGEEYSENARILSSVGRVDLEVTPDSIAGALHYVRPAGPYTYPASDADFDQEAVLDALYRRRSYAQIPHRVGRLKSNYRYALLLMTHNLDPMVHESRPSETMGNMMYAFLSSDTKCDWAKFIFVKMVQFLEAPTHTRMPFPCLISSLARASDQLAQKYRVNDELSPGAISYTTIKMSDAQSRAGTPMLDPPPAHADTKTWLKKVFCLEAAVAKSHRKLKKEVRQVHRQNREQIHQNNWMIKHMSGINQPAYQPPDFEQREDSDDFEGSGSEGD